jgi:hypothetical protein
MHVAVPSCAVAVDGTVSYPSLASQEVAKHHLDDSIVLEWFTGL